jgi:hypothetical protein
VETVIGTASPKTTAALNVLANDVLVAYVTGHTNTSVATISNSGVALAWTQRQVVVVTGYCWVSIWTAVPTGTRPGLTVTFTSTGSTGGCVLQFRDSNGVGASAKTNVLSGAPTLDVTTTSADSAVVVVNADALVLSGAARVWRTNAGALTETQYVLSGFHTVYGGYHASSGAADVVAVGLTAPTGQKYSIAAVEVLGQTPPLMQTASFMSTRE